MNSLTRLKEQLKHRGQPALLLHEIVDFYEVDRILGGSNYSIVFEMLNDKIEHWVFRSPIERDFAKLYVEHKIDLAIIENEIQAQYN